jgi:hypothetical protein
MAESFRDRAVQNLRARHATKLRELAEDITKEAGFVLADLDRGRVPRLRNLLDCANDISRRIAALEVVDEMTGYYAADPEAEG